MVKYTYDAWGNNVVCNPDETANTEPSFIGNDNPFRYRSYYYDIETGLYYLNSRYYDPEVGRFINADSIEYLDPESVNGLNLFSYCGNNPVMMMDPSGHFAIVLDLIPIIPKIFNIGAIVLNIIVDLAIRDLTKRKYAYLNNQSGAGVFNLIKSNLKLSEKLQEFSKRMGLAIAIIGAGISIYENFQTQNLTLNEKITHSFVDIVF